MYRYLLVRGVRGHLVANPHVDPAARRFLGKKPDGPHWEEGPRKDGKPMWPAATEVEEVVQDEAALRKAIRQGGLVLVKECVARDIGDARNQLQPSAEK